MALTLTDEQTTTLLTLLGLPSDTTDVDTVLATVEDLATTENGDAGAPDGPKPSTVAAAARRIGLETVDEATLVSLRAQAAEAVTLKASAARREVEQTVDGAVNAGKIPPARREHWVNLVTADAELGKVLASMPAVIPVAEKGYNVGNEDGSNPGADDLTELVDWFR